MEMDLKKRMAVFLCLAIVLSIVYAKLTPDIGKTDIDGKTEAVSGRAWAGERSNIKEGEPSEKYIAITFDDGPKAGTTDVLLEGLRQRGVHATFFLIGRQVEENEALVEQMIKDGHLIGNHTYNHVNLASLSVKDAWRELSLCFDAIAAVEEEPLKTAEDGALKLVRPPFGEVSAAMKAQIGCPMILWSVDTRDWTGRQAGDIAGDIVETARPGDIILLHDIFENSVSGALMAIDTMMENGYTFVTVEELFGYYGITLEPGKVYRKASS